MLQVPELFILFPTPDFLMEYIEVDGLSNK